MIWILLVQLALLAVALYCIRTARLGGAVVCVALVAVLLIVKLVLVFA